MEMKIFGSSHRFQITIKQRSVNNFLKWVIARMEQDASFCIKSKCVFVIVLLVTKKMSTLIQEKYPT